MGLWQIAGVVFFGYVVLVAMIRPRKAAAVRGAVAGSMLGLLIVAASSVSGQPRVLQVWIWPPLTLLIGYWTSGRLFVAPRPSQETVLRWLDDRLALPAVSRCTPRALAEILEAAYAGVYLLIPVALAAHLRYSATPAPDRFWSVVLITDFVCFGVLPWVQTRPPRALEVGASWPSSIRRFNLRLLGATSIQVNTFPSGHAAEALAAALLVFGAPAAVTAFMFLAALAVSAGAVLGRYHFLADALAGWLVAVVVFLMIW